MSARGTPRAATRERGGEGANADREALINFTFKLSLISRARAGSLAPFPLANMRGL